MFSPESGRLVDEPSIEAIRAIRQICLLHGKLFETPSKRRIRKALHGYVDCELELKARLGNIESHLSDDFRYYSTCLYRDIFLDLDRVIHDQSSEIIPRFGPGATAERFSANQRWREAGWSSRLEQVFPSASFRIANEKYYRVLDQIEFHEPGTEPPVRVISVPKTQKTPRIIAIEPSYNMFIQQALMTMIVKRIENDPLLGSMIGFTDQAPNQEMARLGSSSGSLATLDLSEASDRVSSEHVELLLSRHRQLFNAVFACRSQRAQLPDGEIIHLTKFASMGSALTFPIEAMTFLTLVFVGIGKKLNRRLTRKEISSFSGQVRVYGDDIIVPTETVHQVIESLESFGFKVNSDKSFWNGRFRESCGKEYYDGVDVSLVKFRRRFPKSLGDAKGVQSIVSFRNQLYWSGYWQTVKKLDKTLDGFLKGHYPCVASSSPCLGRESVLGYESQRTDRNLQSDQVRAWVAKQTTPLDELDGVHALTKCLTLMAGRDDPSVLDHLTPPEGVDHLKHSGRPEKTKLTLRWCSPF